MKHIEAGKDVAPTGR